MFADIFRAPGIVKNQGDEQSIRVGVFNEEIAIEFVTGFVIIDEVVQLIDTAQGMFVRGVSVKEFVLHEAVERAELGKIASQNTTAVP